MSPSILQQDQQDKRSLKSRCRSRPFPDAKKKNILSTGWYGSIMKIMDLIWFKYGFSKIKFLKITVYQNMGLVQDKYGFCTAQYGQNIGFCMFCDFLGADPTIGIQND